MDFREILCDREPNQAKCMHSNHPLICFRDYKEFPSGSESYDENLRWVFYGIGDYWKEHFEWIALQRQRVRTDLDGMDRKWPEAEGWTLRMIKHREGKQLMMLELRVIELSDPREKPQSKWWRGRKLLNRGVEVIADYVNHYEELHCWEILTWMISSDEWGKDCPSQR